MAWILSIKVAWFGPFIGQFLLYTKGDMCRAILSLCYGWLSYIIESPARYNLIFIPLYIFSAVEFLANLST